MVSPAGGPQQTVIITPTGSKKVAAPAPARKPVSSSPAPASNRSKAPQEPQEPVVVITATGSKKVAAAEIAANPDDYGVYVPPPPPPEEKGFWGSVGDIAVNIGKKIYSSIKESAIDPLIDPVGSFKKSLKKAESIGRVVGNVAVGLGKHALKFTYDPVGATKDGIEFTKKNWKPITGLVVCAAATYFTFGAASAYTGPVMAACIAGMVGGAAGAATTSTLEGKSAGEVAKDAAIGGAIGAAGGAVGGLAGGANTLAGAAGRGAIQGAVQGAGQGLVAGHSGDQIVEDAIIGGLSGAAGGAVGHGVAGRFSNPNGIHARAVTNGARFGTQGYTESILRGEDPDKAFENAFAGALGGVAGSYASSAAGARLNRTAPTSARQAALRQGVINMAGNMSRTGVTGLGRGDQNVFKNTLMSGAQGFTEGFGEGYRTYRDREIAETRRAHEEALASKRRSNVAEPSDDEIGLGNVHLTSKNTRRVGDKFYYIDETGKRTLLADDKQGADALQTIALNGSQGNAGLTDEELDELLGPDSKLLDSQKKPRRSGTLKLSRPNAQQLQPSPLDPPRTPEQIAFARRLALESRIEEYALKVHPSSRQTVEDRYILLAEADAKKMPRPILDHHRRKGAYGMLLQGDAVTDVPENQGLINQRTGANADSRNYQEVHGIAYHGGKSYVTVNRVYPTDARGSAVQHEFMHSGDIDPDSNVRDQSNRPDLWYSNKPAFVNLHAKGQWAPPGSPLFQNPYIALNRREAFAESGRVYMSGNAGTRQSFPREAQVFWNDYLARMEAANRRAASVASRNQRQPMEKM